MKKIITQILIIVLILILLTTTSILTIRLSNKYGSEVLAKGKSNGKLASDANVETTAEGEETMVASVSNFDGNYTDPDNTNGEWKNSVTVDLQHYVGLVNMYYVDKYCWTTSTDIPSANADWKEPEIANITGTALKPVTSPAGVEGEYYLHLKITCEDSQYNGYVYTGPYYIDDKAPSTPVITNSSGGNWTNKDVTITVESTDNGSGIKCIVWGSAGEWTSHDTQGKEQRIFSEEQNSIISIYSKDNLGNYNEISSTNVRIDKTPPTAGTMTMKLAGGGSNYTSGTWTDQGVYLSVNEGTDELSGHKSTVYSVNGGAETTQAQILKTSGEYNIEVTTTDNAGNIGKREYTVKICKEVPTPTITNPSGGNWTKDPVTVSASVDSNEVGIAKLQYKIGSSGTWTDWSTSTSASKTFAGVYYGSFYVRAIDTLGNISEEASTKLQIDPIAPTITSVTGNPTDWVAENVTLTVNGAKDTFIINGKEYNGVGFPEMPYSFDGGLTWQKENTKTYTESTDGIVIKVRDSLGNTYTHETINITKIRKAENIEITKIPTKTEYTANENFDATGMQVTLTYDNGDKEETTNYTITNGTNLKCGEQKIIIQYNGNTQIKAEIIVSVNHIEVIDQAVVATCETAGKTVGKHCSVCNKVLVAQQTIPATGHTEVIDKAVAATCETAGKTEGKHCSVCNKVLVIQTTIPALGHNYENGICTRCGEKETQEKVEITSEKYEIGEFYITKIQPETTVKELKENLETNAEEVKIYTKNEEASEAELIGTGARIELKLGDETRTWTLVIIGDVNGDGEVKVSDMTIINRCRLHKRTLEGEYLLAGDVTGDGVVDIKDLVKINRYRLHKIEEL